MVLVSVIIPVFNRTLELRRAIESVLKQTVQDFEICVVDDCSDIDLKPIIDEFNDPRINYAKLEKKGNANVCRNVGIQRSVGKYIAMLDSDDEWLPQHLERKILALEMTKSDGVFGSYVIDNGIEKKEVMSRPFYPGETMINYILSDGRAATPTQVYKAECAKHVLWDENLVRHQDYDFSVRFSEKFKFIPSDEITCIVHWRENEKRIENFESRVQFINKHRDKIKPALYNKYFTTFYLQVRNREDVLDKFKLYLKKESTRYIHYCSLIDYLVIEGDARGKLIRYYLRMKYIWRVLFS